MTQDVSLTPSGDGVVDAPVRPGASRQVLWGIAAAMGGSAVFSLNDLCIKQLSGEYALNA